MTKNVIFTLNTSKYMGLDILIVHYHSLNKNKNKKKYNKVKIFHMAY